MLALVAVLLAVALLLNGGPLARDMCGDRRFSGSSGLNRAMGEGWSAESVEAEEREERGVVDVDSSWFAEDVSFLAMSSDAEDGLYECNISFSMFVHPALSALISD